MKIIEEGRDYKQLFWKRCTACDSLLEFTRKDLSGNFSFTLKCEHCSHSMMIQPEELNNLVDPPAAVRRSLRKKRHKKYQKGFFEKLLDKFKTACL